MSLTEEAYRERKWGPFPVLRKALEDKKVPSNYYGITSASDNMFEAMGRLMEIAVLASEYQSDIKETAVSMGLEEMNKDLRLLEKSLEHASFFFKEKIEAVRTLSDSILGQM